MNIESIEIKNFRNIENINLDFKKINIICGDNAQGKTNLIEAIYLLSGLKSFRKAKNGDFIKFGEKKAEITAKTANKIRTEEIKLTVNEKNREVEINKVHLKTLVALGEKNKIIAFTPDHIAIIKSTAEKRREFFDRALCKIKFSYKKLISDYEKCLYQRNNLLKKIPFNKSFEDMLFAWDTRLIILGSKIIYQRNKYIEKAEPYIKEYFRGISDNNDEIDVIYDCKFDCDMNNIDDIKEKFKNILVENRKKDIENKVTTAGPQKSDFIIKINGKTAEKYASQGQQRSAVIAFKLAEAGVIKSMSDEKPVVLLDDVLSELDKSRQNYVLNNISDFQVFITCCDLDAISLKNKDEGKIFFIENGKLKKSETVK